MKNKVSQTFGEFFKAKNFVSLRKSSELATFNVSVISRAFLKEMLINLVLRANRYVATVLKPLRTTKYARALRSSRLALHSAKQIPQHFLN
jgi:hypothetical protein